MSLLSLPPEVLPTIFGFLPAEDRKTVRLTCQLFKDACDREDVLKHEKFVFHLGHFGNDVNLIDFADNIGNCKRLRSDVEFRAVELRGFPLKVWEKFGNRITSLSMHGCGVSDKILAEIFSQCSELVDLCVHVPGWCELFATNTGINYLDLLISRGIRRPKLRTFKLFTHYSLSGETFRKIFAIFPNIQVFGRDRYYRSYRGKSQQDDFRRERRSPFQSIELPLSVENLICNEEDHNIGMAPYINHPTVKFKELDFTLIKPNDLEMSNVTNFLSSQTELRSIALRILVGRRKSDSVKSILQILGKLSKLRALKFHSDCEVDLSASEFNDLLLAINELESLDLCFRPSDKEALDFSVRVLPFELPPTSLQLPLIEYRKLRHLKLDFGYARATRLQSEIISRCRSLRCLHLECVDNGTLENIFRDNMGLRKLYLNFDGCRDILCTGGLSFDHLRRLEHLDMRNVVDRKLSRRTRSNCVLNPERNLVGLVRELDCPRLKVFRSDGQDPYLSGKETIELLRILSEKTPLLETLIMSSQLPFRQYNKHLGKFKKLRYLVRHMPPMDVWHSRLEAPEADRLFDACPLLMYVVDNALDCTIYYYHRKTRSLVTESHLYCKRLCETLNIPSYEM